MCWMTYTVIIEYIICICILYYTQEAIAMVASRAT